MVEAVAHRPPQAKPSSPPSSVTKARVVVLLIAVAAGAAVAAGVPLLGAVLVAPVLLVAGFPHTERLGEVLVFAGFVAVAAFSDSVGNDPGVQQGDLQFSPLKWLAYGLLLTGTLALLLPTGRPPVRMRLPHALLFGYLVCSSAGAALSPEPALFLLRWAQVSLPFAAALVWWRRRGSSGILVTAVLIAAAWHVITAIVALAMGRSYLSGAAGGDMLADEGARLGGVVHPVLLAFSAAVIAAWLLWVILTVPPRRSFPGFVALPIAGLVLGLSRGRTGFLAVLGMVVVVFAVASRRRREAHQNVDPRLFLVVALCVGLVVSSATIVGWFVRGNASEVRTLTNRTRLWTVSTELVLERPVVGWGPGLLRSGKVAEEVRDRVGFVGHAHNALLDACLAGGLVGGGLWLFGFVVVGRALFRRRAPAHSFPAFLPCLWVGLAIWGLVEGNLVGFGFSWFLFLALMVALPPTPSPDEGVPAPPRIRKTSALPRPGRPGPAILTSASHHRSAGTR